MRKVLLSTVALSVFGSMLYAGPKYEITPMVGKKVYNYSDDAPRFDDGEVLLGIRANAYLSDRTSLQLGVENSKGNKEGTGSPTAYQGAETDMTRSMLNLQYDIPSRGKITPYVQVGGGYEKLQRSEPSTGLSSQAFYNVGGGLRYSVNPRVDLVAEGRVIHKVEDQDDDAIGSVGVGFKFGNTCSTAVKKKGIPVKALTMAELAALTAKKQQATVPAPTVAPVAPAVVAAPVVVESTPVVEAPKTVARKIVYDTSEVNVCDVVNNQNGVVSDTVSMDDVSGYFVQVIALRKNSPDVIVSRLDAKGYNHTLKEEGSLTRVLVGPYETRKAAAIALKGLKSIKKDAFIYHAK